MSANKVSVVGVDPGWEGDIVRFNSEISDPGDNDAMDLTASLILSCTISSQFQGRL